MADNHAKCQDCGAYVENVPQHKAWHSQIDRKMRDMENEIARLGRATGS